MSLKTRVAKLEEKFNIGHEEMPEGLSSQDQYLWLIRQPLPMLSQTDKIKLSPEEAYLRLISNTD
jgi:hypothetical protein